MTNKDKIFAQNWIEQWRNNLESARLASISATAMVNRFPDENAWTHLINMSFEWARTPEYRINQSVWSGRYNSADCVLIR